MAQWNFHWPFRDLRHLLFSGSTFRADCKSLKDAKKAVGASLFKCRFCSCSHSSPVGAGAGEESPGAPRPHMAEPTASAVQDKSQDLVVLMK